MKRILLPILIIGVLLLGACGAPTPTPAPAPNITPSPDSPSSTTTPITKTYIYIDGRIVLRGSGEPIELINNPDATDPTFAELVAFIERDRTDEYPYIVGPPKNAFICSDFAETVHNNAEAAGIRAAWVGIDIEGETEGHALNAFQTTDLGLVYIDSTGKGLWDDPANRSSWDRRAYVKIGEQYEVADIDKAKTQFRFLVTTPIGADNMTMEELEEQTLRTLELSGWIRLPTSGEREQKSHELLEWLRIHDIEALGQRWIQEWIQEHEAELSKCSREEYKLHLYTGEQSFWDIGDSGSESHITRRGWYMMIDCLETSWFQPIEKLIDVDGIPIVWKIRWKMSNLWSKPLAVWSSDGNQLVGGFVKDIHIHW